MPSQPRAAGGTRRDVVWEGKLEVPYGDSTYIEGFTAFAPVSLLFSYCRRTNNTPDSEFTLALAVCNDGSCCSPWMLGGICAMQAVGLERLAPYTAEAPKNGPPSAVSHPFTSFGGVKNTRPNGGVTCYQHPVVPEGALQGQVGQADFFRLCTRIASEHNTEQHRWLSAAEPSVAMRTRPQWGAVRPTGPAAGGFDREVVAAQAEMLQLPHWACVVWPRPKSALPPCDGAGGSQTAPLLAISGSSEAEAEAVLRRQYQQKGWVVLPEDEFERRMHTDNDTQDKPGPLCYPPLLQHMALLAEARPGGEMQSPEEALADLYGHACDVFSEDADKRELARRSLATAATVVIKWSYQAMKDNCRSNCLGWRKPLRLPQPVVIAGRTFHSVHVGFFASGATMRLWPRLVGSRLLFSPTDLHASLPMEQWVGRQPLLSGVLPLAPRGVLAHTPVALGQFEAAAMARRICAEKEFCRMTLPGSSRGSSAGCLRRPLLLRGQDTQSRPDSVVPVCHRKRTRAATMLHGLEYVLPAPEAPALLSSFEGERVVIIQEGKDKGFVGVVEKVECGSSNAFMMVRGESDPHRMRFLPAAGFGLLPKEVEDGRRRLRSRR